MVKADDSLLGEDEPAPVTVRRADGASPFFLTCDHAGNRIPRRLATLGLDAGALQRHIAWDLGAAALAGAMSDRLDATLVQQTYSRLVIDCNRHPEMPTAMPAISEDTEIPGNRNLDAARKRARVREIWAPYHDCIAGRLDAREPATRPCVLVAMHSFTPVFHGVHRPWHVGVLYNRDPRLAHIMLDLLRATDGLVVGDNQPYRVSDRTDYSIPVHGERRGIPHVEIEIRQDLLAVEPDRRRWAERLADLLRRAYERI